MTAITATLIMSIVAVIILAVVTVLALLTKGSVRASGNIGAGFFSIEAHEKTRRR